jgi:hypothetical protein
VGSGATLVSFQTMCHEYYTCYVFASDGMEKLTATIPLDSEKYPDQRIFIGNTPPDQGKAQSVMSAAKAVANAKRDGEFQDILGKSLLIRIYAEWDERYRAQIGQEFGVSAREVQADLMGDLRRIRHWIVHSKSLIGKDAPKVAVLPWQLEVGRDLHVTSAMFRELADCLNTMTVRVAT